MALTLLPPQCVAQPRAVCFTVLMNKLEHCTVAQAAAVLGVDRATVRRWVEAGRLSSLAKLPGRTGAYLLDPAEVQALAQKRAAS